MRILWIEDESNPDICVNNCFKAIDLNLHKVEQVKDFEDAHRLITINLERFDYVVIDINLEHSSLGEHAESLIEQFGNLNQANFREAAGFHLFIELLEKGFPKERIIFFTANASSGQEKLNQLAQTIRQASQNNDIDAEEQAVSALRVELPDSQKPDLDKALAEERLIPFLAKLEAITPSQPQTENVYETFRKQFQQARITPPSAISKFERGGFDQWLSQHFDHDPENPLQNYLILRRGIFNVIEGLKKNEKSLTEDFSSDFDKVTFLEGLNWLLQAHELRPEQAEQFYLTLCDTLTKPFERFKLWDLITSKIPDRSCRIPAYFLRNWIAHGLITGSQTHLSAQDTGFTFLIVMQSLFGQELYGDGNELRQLYGEISDDQKVIRDQIVKLQKRIYKNPHKIEKLEEIKSKGQKQDDGEWKRENFRLHFYASYILASTRLETRFCKDNERFGENKYTVYLNYELQKTPFLGIASSQLKQHLLKQKGRR